MSNETDLLELLKKDFQKERKCIFCEEKFTYKDSVGIIFLIIK
jgi:hypothetical protein